MALAQATRTSRAMRSCSIAEILIGFESAVVGRLAPRRKQMAIEDGNLHIHGRASVLAGNRLAGELSDVRDVARHADQADVSAARDPFLPPQTCMPPRAKNAGWPVPGGSVMAWAIRSSAFAGGLGGSGSSTS